MHYLNQILSQFLVKNMRQNLFRSFIHSPTVMLRQAQQDDVGYKHIALLQFAEIKYFNSQKIMHNFNLKPGT